MITLLRKIRKRLIKESQFSNYLLYAIGEITLVVIGILIALQINNWNEAQKDRRVENQALINLKKEFDENQKRLQFLMEMKQEQEDDCRSYLELVTNDTIPIEEKVKAARPNSFAGTWGATNAVLNSLLSTGGIDKIENDSLKFLLNNWPVVTNRYLEREKRFDAVIEELSAFEDARVPNNIVKPGTHRDLWPGNYFPNNMASRHEALKPEMIIDFRYQNIIAKMAGVLYIQLIIATEIQDSYEAISKLIISELKARKIELNAG